MKRNFRIALISVVMLIAFSIPIYAYMKTVNTGKIYTSNGPVTTLSEQQKNKVGELKEKLQSERTSVGEDIWKTHKIDKSFYTLIEIKDMPEFNDGLFPGFPDKEFCIKILTIYDENMKSLVSGDYMPYLLIHNNMKELVFAYKTKEGKNIVRKYELNNGEWVKVSDVTIDGEKFVPFKLNK